MTSLMPDCPPHPKHPNSNNATKMTFFKRPCGCEVEWKQNEEIEEKVRFDWNYIGKLILEEKSGFDHLGQVM